MEENQENQEITLTLAVYLNRLEDVKNLLRDGANVDRRSEDRSMPYRGYTPLFLAVANKNEKIAKELLVAGASIDKLCGQRTPLFLAVQMKSTKIIELLLRYRANPHAVCCLKDGFFQSPFYFALKTTGYTKECGLLLEATIFNLVSAFKFPTPEKISIHKSTVAMMQQTLRWLVRSASTENPLTEEKMKTDKGEAIINQTIIRYDWQPVIEAEVGQWGFPNDFPGEPCGLLGESRIPSIRDPARSWGLPVTGYSEPSILGIVPFALGIILSKSILVAIIIILGMRCLLTRVNRGRLM